MTKIFTEEAMNTVKATLLEIKLAKLLGKKSKHFEYGREILLSKWRGKVYLIDVK